MRTRKLIELCCSVALVFCLMSGTSLAAPYAIVGADQSNSSTAAALMATGKISGIDTFNTIYQTPTLAQLSSYTAILAFTNYPPINGTQLGDVLASYVDGGGSLVLATYGFSSPWAISGRIMTSGYSPLLNVGVNTDVSGNLVAVAPEDPLFSGINLGAVTYFHNTNFSNPVLDAGATLLATDGSGIEMIARNSDGNILAFNMFPSGDVGNSEEFYDLLANGLTETQPVPEPGTIILLGAGFLGLAAYGKRRKKA